MKPLAQHCRILLVLPVEIWFHIYAHLSSESHSCFPLVCSAFAVIARHPFSVATRLRTTFTPKLALYFAMKRNVLTPTLGNMLIQNGSVLPRYLIQHAFRSSDHVCPALLSWLGQQAASLYHHDEDSLDLLEDDVVTFRNLLNTLNPHDVTAQIRSKLADLIVRYGFFPPPEDERFAYILYKLGKIDIDLLTLLMKKNGYRIDAINDEFMKWVLRKEFQSPKEALAKFQRLGFKLTSSVVNLGLQLARNEIIGAFKECVPEGELSRHVLNTLESLLGPDRLCTSEHILEHLRHSFSIPLATIKGILLTHKSTGCPQKDQIKFRTRCYHQQHPATIWKWIFRIFPSSDEIVQACFDDIMQKLGSKDSQCCLRPLPEHFLRAGISISVQHLPDILRIAQREETLGVAEFILEHLYQTLVLDRYSDESKADWDKALSTLWDEEAFIASALGTSRYSGLKRKRGRSGAATVRATLSTSKPGLSVPEPSPPQPAAAQTPPSNSNLYILIRDNRSMVDGRRTHIQPILCDLLKFEERLQAWAEKLTELQQDRFCRRSKRLYLRRQAVPAQSSE
ncbi:uncharacterized protein BJ171DRAFT_633866 [Polychytrium aggregatum]|uniref:uncharacterized protein n=1 Tax=Polychytrium aggregatum TaxID=110093 RepID=UPI0022FF0EE9|nr:uncharacterized protein BJ171DRAFT_633866 [Polychytrium aggregatum]KAI9208114.1 hypothetical protein BJ171DRAFT_633866 [Polychytrium aggregatum]